MSIFRMRSIACMARAAAAPSDEARRRGRASGTICHERSNRSFSQPHWLSLPPSAISACQRRSVSSWSCVLTEIEAASECLNSGPPFSAWYGVPLSVKSTTSGGPSGSGRKTASLREPG